MGEWCFYEKNYLWEYFSHVLHQLNTKTTGNILYDYSGHKYALLVKIHSSGGNFTIYRVARENLYTFKIAAILAVWTLQRCVIRGWNGNSVGFSGIFSKIVKNYSHFYGKTQNWPTRIWNLTLKFEAIWGQYGHKPIIFVYLFWNIV